MSDPKFIPCPDWAEKLASLHSHHLSPSDREALEAHLESCRACSSVLFEYQEMDERIHRALSAKALPTFQPEQLRAQEKVYGPGGEQEALATAGASRLSRLRWFITVQVIALVGWIIIQLLLFLSPAGRELPVPVLLTVEAIQLLSTLAVMFVLFRRVYMDFLRATLELEETKQRLEEIKNREARRNIQWGATFFDTIFDPGEQL